MLKFVRKGATSLLGTLMLGAISLVFVLSFGPGARGCQSVNPNQNIANYVIKLNGKKVGIGEYQELRKKVYLEQQRQKKRLSENELNKVVIERLVAEQLYLAFAKKLSLTVTNKEKDNYITNLPYFQVNKKFDYPTYKKIVQNYFNTTPLQYEKDVKKDIIIHKAMDILTSSISITDDKLWEEYKEKNKSIDLSFIKIPLKKDETKITDEEANKFLASNEKKVKKYFDSHKDEFTHAKEVEASHILIKVDKNKTDAQAKKEIEKIAKEVKNADFSELAKKYSEGPSKTTGGKLGYFTKNKMVKEFSEVAFKLKINEVSKPVKTKFGYHLIKVTNIKEAYSDKYEDVKLSISKNLIKEKKKKEAIAKLKLEIKEKIKNAKNLTELAKLIPGSKIETAKAITYNPYSYIPNLGIVKNLMNEIFKSKIKKGTINPNLYYLSDSILVTQIDKINLDKEKFEADKAKIREQALIIDKSLFLNSWIENKRLASNLVVHPNYLPKK